MSLRSTHAFEIQNRYRFLLRLNSLSLRGYIRTCPSTHRGTDVYLPCFLSFFVQLWTRSLRTCPHKGWCEPTVPFLLDEHPDVAPLYCLAVADMTSKETVKPMSQKAAHLAFLRWAMAEGSRCSAVLPAVDVISIFTDLISSNCSGWGMVFHVDFNSFTFS